MRMNRFRHPGRFGAAYPPLWPALLSAALLATHTAHAARPMITDDVRIVDAKACQLESWVKKNPNGTEIWVLPACNFTGNLELTLGGATTREAGRPQTTDVVMQGKTLAIGTPTCRLAFHSATMPWSYTPMLRFWQEAKSNKAADALKAMVSNTVTVIRRDLSEMVIGIFLPMGLLAHYFKLQALPPLYFVFLHLILLTYMGLTQAMKGLYFRRYGWQ